LEPKEAWDISLKDEELKSIKGKLTSLLTIGLFLMSVIGGIAFYQIVKVMLTNQFDQELINWANNTSEMFDFEDSETDSAFQNTLFDDQYLPGDRKYYQAWTADGSTISRSLSLKNTELPFSDIDLQAFRFENIKLPGGIEGRVVSYSYVNHRMAEGASAEDAATESHNTLIFSFAQSRAGLDNILLIIRLCLLGVGVILLTGSYFIIRQTVKVGLVPLLGMAKKTADINSNDLTQRFSEERLPEELLPITSRLNEMLERLETAFSREKRFTANVAHELRTPIAELRTLAEVGQTEACTDSDDIRTYFNDALDIAIQMQNLTDSLL